MFRTALTFDSVISLTLWHAPSSLLLTFQCCYWELQFFQLEYFLFITSLCGHLTYIETLWKLWNEAWIDPMEMFCSRHTFFMTRYGSSNIRWCSCTPMCHWLRDITLSSNVLTTLGFSTIIIGSGWNNFIGFIPQIISLTVIHLFIEVIWYL